ncbi:GIY-YIG nuclease family protein [Caproicibacterium sp. NSD3]
MDWLENKYDIDYINYLTKKSDSIKYPDIYKFPSRNNYKELQEFKGKYGAYLFTEDETNTVLYVGQATTQSLYVRVKQHFVSSDTGGLRYKLRNKKGSLNKLNQSKLYVIPLDVDDKRKILFFECYLISKFQPAFNFKVG